MKRSVAKGYFSAKWISVAKGRFSFPILSICISCKDYSLHNCGCPPSFHLLAPNFTYITKMDTILTSGHGNGNPDEYGNISYTGLLSQNNCKYNQNYVHFEIFAFLYHKAKFRTEGFGIPYLMSTE